jgi:hypothetical protein
MYVCCCFWFLTDTYFRRRSNLSSVSSRVRTQSDATIFSHVIVHDITMQLHL